MRSVTLTIASIVLFAFASNTVSALPVVPSHLADGNVDAVAFNGASSIDKRGLLGGLTGGALGGALGGVLGGGGSKKEDTTAKAAAKASTADDISSKQKRGLLDGVPIVGGLVGGGKSSGTAATSAEKPAEKNAAAKASTADDVSSKQKRGLLDGVPIVGELVGGAKPKQKEDEAKAAGSTGSEETKA